VKSNNKLRFSGFWEVRKATDIGFGGVRDRVNGK